MGRPYQPAGSRARRIRRPGSGHDQQAVLVVNVGTGRLQAGPADPEVVAAQQELNRVRMARSRWHHHSDHRPGRAAASPRGNVQRYGSLQLGKELLARGSRPARPPPLHRLTIAPAWTGHQGHCSCPVWPWVLLRLCLRVPGLPRLDCPARCLGDDVPRAPQICRGQTMQVTSRKRTDAAGTRTWRPMPRPQPVRKMACGAISLRRYCPDQVLGVAVQLPWLSGFSAFPRTRFPWAVRASSSLSRLADILNMPGSTRRPRG